MAAFEVRRASPSDADALAVLVSQLGYPSTPAEMRDRLAGLLSDPGYRLVKDLHPPGQAFQHARR